MPVDRYNQHFPLLLGQEWVPIRDESIQFIPASSVEYGYRFRYDEGAAGLSDRLPQVLLGTGPNAPVLQPFWQRQGFTVNLYREGNERRAGTIRTLTVPTMSITATGNAASSTDAMVEFRYTAEPPPTQGVDFYFDFEPYRAALFNKRILNVSLVYTGSSNDVTVENGITRDIPISYDPQYQTYTNEPLTKIAVVRTFSQTSGVANGELYYLSDTGPRGWGALPGLIFQPIVTTAHPTAILRVEQPPETALSFGNVIRQYDTVNSFNFSGEWSFDVLRKLNQFATDRYAVRCYVQLPNTPGHVVSAAGIPRIRLYTVALRVTYCDENRIASATVNPVQAVSSAANLNAMVYGLMHSPLLTTSWFTDSFGVFDRYTFYKPGAFPLGNYVLTVSYADKGEDGGVRDRFGPVPIVATRELGQNPSFPGVQIDVPFPASDPAIVEGKTLTVKESSILPQLFLGDNAGDSLGVKTHAYSKQIDAPLYETFRATQRVTLGSAALNSISVLGATSATVSGAVQLPASFPNIRFWARRFGDTSVPLRVQADMDPGFFITGTQNIHYATPDTGVLDTTGDMDIRLDLSIYPALDSNILFVSKDDGPGQRSYALGYLGPILGIRRGTISWAWSENGTTTHQHLLDLPFEWDWTPRRGFIKFQWDVDTGGGTSQSTLFQGPTINGPWTIVSSVTGPSSATSVIFNSTAPVRIGPTAAALAGGFGIRGGEAMIYAVQINNGIDPAGTPVTNPDFTGLAPGTTSFVDTLGRPWSAVGGAENQIFDSAAIPTAEITPATFDGLEKLTTDGWAQVDLRFNTPYRVNTERVVNRDWINLVMPSWLRWSADGEHAGSRWEVLGAGAYEISGGIPGSWSTACPIVPSQVGLTTVTALKGISPYYTYGDIRGHLNWYEQYTHVNHDVMGTGFLPAVSTAATGFVDDLRSDLSFILAMDAPEVSGFGVSNAQQVLTSLTDTCGLGPDGIPTHLDYLTMRWDQAPDTARIKDNFDREVVEGWGQVTTPPVTLPWITLGNVNTGMVLRGSNRARAVTPDNAALDITGDIDVRIDICLDSWTPAVGQQLITRRDAANDNSFSMFVSAGATGTIGFQWSADGTNFVSGTSTVPVTPGANNRLSVRATLDVDDGGGNHVTTFYTSTDTDLATATWVQLGAAVTAAGVTSIFNSSQPLEVGNAATSFSTRTIGTVYSAMVMNGINGTVVAYPIFSNQLPGTTSFTDSPGRIWSLVPPAHIAAPLYVSDGIGYINTEIAPGPVHGAYLGSNCGPDFEATVTVQNLAPIMDLGNIAYTQFVENFTTPVNMELRGRYTDENNYYWLRVTFAPIVTGFSPLDSALQQGLVLTLGKQVAGISTVINTRQAAPPTQGFGVGAGVHLRWIISENMLKVKYWDIGAPENPTWFMDYQDPAITTGSGFALVASHASAKALIAYSNLEITAPKFWFGGYEIQRMDTEDTDWQTIMKASNPAVLSFNDYEARAGITSWYRIRQSLVSSFPGPWSDPVSGMVPAPGVLGSNINHLLMFTSNENQNGELNVAYNSIFEGTVEEPFTFPESTFVQMQLMYNKNFYTAFRPLERGGEQFTREVLVQAMAISPAKLANFTSLRDMAWDDVNYICVRDESGNRWLASVEVPSGRVRRYRTIYSAPVEITEVTDTPTPVNPAWLP